MTIMFLYPHAYLRQHYSRGSTRVHANLAPSVKEVGCWAVGPDYNQILMGASQKMNHKGKVKVNYAGVAD